MIKKAIFLIILMIFIACESATAPKDDNLTPQNQIEINDMYTNDETVIVNEVVSINVDYSYSGNDNIEFSWFCNSGNFLENKGAQGSNSMLWKAPYRPGIFNITVSISDGTESIQEDIQIRVYDDDSIEPNMA